MTKVVFYSALILIAAMIIAADQKMETTRKVFRELVEIDGKPYFVSSAFNSRDDTKAICEAQNMTMVAFDDAAEWTAVGSWLSANELAWSWYWTGGVRDQNTTTWYWEPTGQEVNEFFWIAGQPNVDPELVNRTCINFNVDQGGWDDDDCSMHLMATVCE